MASVEDSDLELRPLPPGKKYLVVRADRETECVAATDAFFPTAGNKAPTLYTRLGDAMGALDGIASCYWGCRRADHAIEYLLGRGSSATSAARLLLRNGYYDEALALIRTAAEIVNLLFLFRLSEDAFNKWQTLEESQRKVRYGPVKVRLAIEKLDSFVPIDENHYRELSRRSVHANPSTLPQGYNPVGIPTLGGFFQQTGALVALNELGYVTALLLLVAIAHVDVPVNIRNKVLDIAESVYDSVGSINTQNIDQLFKSQRAKRSDPPLAKDEF